MVHRKGDVLVLLRGVTVRPGHGCRPEARIEQVRPERECPVVVRLRDSPAPVPNLDRVDRGVINEGEVPVTSAAPRITERARMVDRDHGALGVSLLDDPDGTAAPSRVTPIDRLPEPEAIHVTVERRYLAAADRRDAVRPAVQLSEVTDRVVVGDGQEVLPSLHRATDSVGHRDLAVAVNGMRVQVSAIPTRGAGPWRGLGSRRCRRWWSVPSRTARTSDPGRGLQVVRELAGLDSVVEDLAGAEHYRPPAGGNRAHQEPERGV